ncbi:MAG: WD40 repeat domain-containing protein, partial [Chloroflexota bacterium]
MQAVTGHSDGTVRLWDVDTGKQVQPLTGPVGAVSALAFTPEDRTLASLAIASHQMKLWDIATRRERFALQGLNDPPQTDHPSAVAFSPDGTLMASAETAGSTIKLRNPTSGRQQSVLGRMKHWINCLTFSPDSALLAAAGGHPGNAAIPGQVKVWNLVTRAEVLTLDQTGSVVYVSFSPDQRMLATANMDGTVNLWNAADGRRLGPLQGYVALSNCVLFFPDGRTICTIGPDGSLKLWDVMRRQDRTWPGKLQGIARIVIGPDGKSVASCGRDGRVILWDAVTGAKLREWQLPGPVHAVAFAADGRHLATANGNGTVYILRIAPPPPQP